MIKSNLFGLLMSTSPLERLVEAHVIIMDSVSVVNEALDSYPTEGQPCPFQVLKPLLGDLKSQAERMIHSIRNSLPNCILLPVNKSLILDYICLQEHILNSAQEGLYWLSIKKVSVPGKIWKDMLVLSHKTRNMFSIVGSILEETVSQVHLESLDRDKILEKHELIQERKKELSKFRLSLDTMIYDLRKEFKDIYPLIQFTARMSCVSRNCVKSADTLRSMLPR